MTAVRTLAHSGWQEVRGPEADGLVAVVAVAEADVVPIRAAAAGGLVPLLEALTGHGLAAATDFGACARTGTGLRVVLRGAAVVVLPDGTRVGSQGRMPWLDVDLDLAPDEVDQVVLEAPEPAPVRSRGWQLPARLRREAPPETPDAPPSSDERTHRVATSTLEVPGPTTEFPPARVPSPGGDPSEVEPRSLGVLRLSTGGSVPLDRGVLLGRAPRVDEDVPVGARPYVLRVGGPDRDISRNHAEFLLEGPRVLVRDLGSTNGTTVTRPGQEAVRLRPGEPCEIEPGTVVVLAAEVALTYEVQQ